MILTMCRPKEFDIEAFKRLTNEQRNEIANEEWAIDCKIEGNYYWDGQWVVSVNCSNPECKFDLGYGGDDYFWSLFMTEEEITEIFSYDDDPEQRRLGEY